MTRSMVRPVRTPPCPLERSVPRCSPLCASRQGVDTTLASRAGPPSARVAHRSVSSTARPSPQPCAASPGSRRGEMPTCIAWSRVGATTRGRSTTGTTTARRCVRGVPAMRPSGSHEAVRRQVRQTLALGRHGVRAPARGGGGGEQRGGRTTVRVHASSSPSSSGGPPPDRPSGERSLSQTAAVLLLTVLAMVLSTANRALPSPSPSPSPSRPLRAYRCPAPGACRGVARARRRRLEPNGNQKTPSAAPRRPSEHTTWRRTLTVTASFPSALLPYGRFGLRWGCAGCNHTHAPDALFVAPSFARFRHLQLQTNSLSSPHRGRTTSEGSPVHQTSTPKKSSAALVAVRQ